MNFLDNKTLVNWVAVVLLLVIVVLCSVTLSRLNRNCKGTPSMAIRSLSVKGSPDDYPETACEWLPGLTKEMCQKWYKQPKGFKAEMPFCDGGDPKSSNCTWGADAENCCACTYKGSVGNKKCGTPPDPSTA